MCGAVRFEAIGPPSRVLHCHCKSCRGHTGAAMATLAVFGASQVSFSGEDRKTHFADPGIGRSFCHTCGSSLTWETQLKNEGEVCAIHISAFDNPEVLKPIGHTFYPERISWFDVHDDLPRHEGFFVDGKVICLGPVKSD